MLTHLPPITDRKIRFAVIGCGRISANHFAALQAHASRAELVAVCDTDHELLEKAAQQSGATAFASLRDLLASSDVDVVALCTPSGLHPDQTVEIAKSGRHVLTEKPMATRWADGKRMVPPATAPGVRLFVVKQNRRNATLQFCSSVRWKGSVWQDLYGHDQCVLDRPQSYYDSAKWRGTWEFDGGAFMNQASHYIDLLDW